MNNKNLMMLVGLVLLLVVLFGGYKIYKSSNGAMTSNNRAYTSSSPSSSPMMSASPQAVTNEMTVNLSQQNSSGEMGAATLKEENGKITVTIDVTGFTAGVSQPAHIHMGSCPDVGGVKYPLTNVVDGKSTTVINTTIADLKAAFPLAINLHKSATEASVYTACGDLK